MLKVYLTIDTEIWLKTNELPTFSQDFYRCFYGRTPEGDFGVPYQINLLNQFGLKAVFLIEALFASVVGLGPLKEMVALVQEGGQDIQLHVHTEWLSLMEEPIIPNRFGIHLRHFNEDEQRIIIEKALANLKEAGASNVCAFRAGNFGADMATLRALAHNNIAYDTSYNFCYLDTACNIRLAKPLVQPQAIEKTVEFPISFFLDRPGHYRHTQLTACSFSEMKHALLQAYDRGWQTFVIVSHSFELLNLKRTHPDPVVIRRFHKLCHFLAENKNKFCTSVFNSNFKPKLSSDYTPLHGRVQNTVWRVGEQLFRRILNTISFF